MDSLEESHHHPQALKKIMAGCLSEAAHVANDENTSLLSKAQKKQLS
jgi:hypothetical protein